MVPGRWERCTLLYYPGIPWWVYTLLYMLPVYTLWYTQHASR